MMEDFIVIKEKLSRVWHDVEQASSRSHMLEKFRTTS